MIGGIRQVLQREGVGAVLTGAGPTFAGYFMQGAFKFGGYEFFKQQSINFLGLERPAKTVLRFTLSLPPAPSSSHLLLSVRLRLLVFFSFLNLASQTG
jgi:hypothetical protein